MKNLIQQGKICPYCNKPTILTDSKIIYGTSYGLIYLCESCRAYVGVHKGTEIALGRLANEELRELKKQSHYYFDNLWNRKMLEGFSKTKSRRFAYKWLSEQMNIPYKETHIGMFNEEQCQLAINICKPFYKNI